MAVPEIAKFKSTFDKQMGEGSFEKHVIDHGSSEFAISRKYVEPLVAVQHVYAKWKPLFEDKLEQINKQESAPKKAPTNLGAGRAGTVVKKRVKSLADLKRISNELAREGGY